MIWLWVAQDWVININSIFGFRIYADAHIGRGETENTLTQVEQDFMA